MANCSLLCNFVAVFMHCVAAVAFEYDKNVNIQLKSTKFHSLSIEHEEGKRSFFKLRLIKIYLHDDWYNHEGAWAKFRLGLVVGFTQNQLNFEG